MGIDDGFRRAAAANRDDWLARRHCLDRGDAEVLLAGHQIRRACDEEIEQTRTRHVALERHSWSCALLERRPFRPITNDDQPPTSPRRRVDREVDAAVAQ